MKNKLSDKTVEKIQGAIISSFETLFYLEEIKKVAPHVFRHKTKLNLSRTLEDLKEIEKTYFNEIDKIDKQDLTNKVVTNKLIFTEWLLNEFDYNDFVKFQQVAYAFKINRERVTGITDKILIENNKK